MNRQTAGFSRFFENDSRQTAGFSRFFADFLEK